MIWGMVIDLKRCIGCQACTMACKEEYGTPRGIFWTKTLVEEVGSYPNVTRIFIPQICNHCDEAPCEAACPTGATYTDEDSGCVLVDYNKCVGCRACAVACPYNNRHYLPNGGLAPYWEGKITSFEEDSYKYFQEGTSTKCVGCIERVNVGLDPACVVACPTDARIFGDLSDPDSEVRKLIRARHGVQPSPEKGTEPKIYYVD